VLLLLLLRQRFDSAEALLWFRVLSPFLWPKIAAFAAAAFSSTADSNLGPAISPSKIAHRVGVLPGPVVRAAPKFFLGRAIAA
jgi:hypothetical protein